MARSANNSAAVPITDPNGSSKIGTPILANGGANEGGVSGADKAAGNDASTQPWKILDLGGMGLKNLSRELFGYSFLTALYINHNNLHHLSSDISRLRHLTILDASGNKLTTVPPEIGLLTHLQELLLVDNALVTLPPELGTLFQLDIVALEGNPLNESLRNMLQQEGTGAVIAYLRENCPGNEKLWYSLPFGGGKELCHICGPSIFALTLWLLFLSTRHSPPAATRERMDHVGRQRSAEPCGI